jgi:hypothetical protein
MRSTKALWAEPEDLTTAHADGVVEVYTIPAEPELMAAVKKEVFLRLLDGGPDLELQIEDEELASLIGVSHSAFRVRPTSTLENRWYVFGFHSLPEIFEPNRYRKLPDGLFGMRFHPASGPTLREVVSCAKLERTLVDVHFSERIPLEGLAETLEVTLGGEKCSLETEGFGDGTGETFRFWCNPKEPADVEVVFHPGIKGVAGGDFKLLNGESSAALSFTLSAGEPREEGCRFWTTP